MCWYEFIDIEMRRTYVRTFESPTGARYYIQVRMPESIATLMCLRDIDLFEMEVHGVRISQIWLHCLFVGGTHAE